MRRHKKPLLCRLGFHKAASRPVVALAVKGKHKWRIAHIVCKRCGKKLRRLTWKKGGKFDLWTEKTGSLK